MIERLALLSFHHRWRTVLLWLALVVGLVAASGAFAGEFENGGRLRGTDSDQAYQLLGKAFPHDDGESVAIAFHTDAAGGLADPNSAATIDRFVDTARSVAHVGTVSGPVRLSEDGRTGVGTLVFVGAQKDQADAIAELRRAAATAKAAGVDVDYASYGFVDGGMNANAEIVGIIAAIVILLISFGSVIAMGLPILSALIGVGAAGATVGLWAAVVATPDFSAEVAAMIGLGVGIDYAVFIITRYRRAQADGRSAEQAIREAMGTAGRAVAFAGAIVMVSLLGMMLAGLSSFNGLALASATSVFVAVLAALTLVPALLSITGRRIGKRAVVVAHRERETFWHRWARFVQRRAAVSVLAGGAALVLLAAPIAAMRLATTDLGSSPKGSTTRVAYDRLAAAFGPGANGPLVIAVPTPDAAARARVDTTTKAIAAMTGVAAVEPAVAAADGSASQITVYPTTGPQDSGTTKLVHRLRAYLRDLPGPRAHVGGSTASDIDFADLMGSRLPVFIAVVLSASFVLLMIVFRSVLVPLKAVVLNLMSIGAAYGLMVMVFQWGWFAGLFGIERGAPIEPWAPMILFAIVFGLSMDYEVFLLSSVHERFRRSGDNSSAVVEGLASTARVITAAASIMVMVFGAFVFNDNRSLKLIGFGLATAVLVDATIVRMLLVPATMQLLGARNWWMPSWLDRLLPHLSLEDQDHQLHALHEPHEVSEGHAVTGPLKTHPHLPLDASTAPTRVRA